jgi:hypothetical protein
MCCLFRVTAQLNVATRNVIKEEEEFGVDILGRYVLDYCLLSLICCVFW